MTDQIRAPWTPEQVAALNRFQREGGMHPFTCGGDHAPGSPALVAYTDGWRCSQPYGEACDYRQDWAHAFMADPDAWPKSPFAEAAQTAPDNPATSGDAADNSLREQYAAALSTLTVLGGAPPAKLVPVIDWGAGKTTRIADWQPLHALLDVLLAVRDRELERLEKLHQAHLRVEARLAGESLVAEAAVERVRLLIAVHRQRLQLADPVLWGKLERVVRTVGELEAAGGGPTVAEAAAGDRRWALEREGE